MNNEYLHGLQVQLRNYDARQWSSSSSHRCRWKWNGAKKSGERPYLDSRSSLVSETWHLGRWLSGSDRQHGCWISSLRMPVCLEQCEADGASDDERPLLSPTDRTLSDVDPLMVAFGWGYSLMVAACWPLLYTATKPQNCLQELLNTCLTPVCRP